MEGSIPAHGVIGKCAVIVVVVFLLLLLLAIVL